MYDYSIQDKCFAHFRIENLRHLLDARLENATWNFDLEDCDNILRIDSAANVSGSVAKILRDNGYDCEEL